MGRRGEEGLVTRRAGPKDARSRSPRDRHGVGVDDAGPRVGAVRPWGSHLLRLTAPRRLLLLAAAPAAVAAAPATRLLGGSGRGGRRGREGKYHGGAGGGGCWRGAGGAVGGGAPRDVPAARAWCCTRFLTPFIRRSSNRKYAMNLGKEGSGIKVRLEAALPKSSLRPAVSVERRSSSPTLNPTSLSSSERVLSRRQ